MGALRRSRVEIWTDILQALQNAAEGAPGMPPSRIQSRANVPHDRFWKHISEMEQKGLVQSEPLRATEEGTRFLSRSDLLRGYMTTDDESDASAAARR